MTVGVPDVWPGFGSPVFDSLNNGGRWDKANERLRVQLLRHNEQNQLNRLGWREMVRSYLGPDPIDLVIAESGVDTIALAASVKLEKAQPVAGQVYDEERGWHYPEETG